MILNINGLLLPPSIDGKAELTADDTTRRTVSGRLITKLAATEKWRITVAFGDDALTENYMADFYDMCAAMRTHAGQIHFVSPYDGTEKLITAKCVERTLPRAVNICRGAVQYYTGAGAVFEEV